MKKYLVIALVSVFTLGFVASCTQDDPQEYETLSEDKDLEEDKE